MLLDSCAHGSPDRSLHSSQRSQPQRNSQKTTQSLVKQQLCPEIKCKLLRTSLVPKNLLPKLAPGILVPVTLTVALQPCGPAWGRSFTNSTWPNRCISSFTLPCPTNSYRAPPRMETSAGQLSLTTAQPCKHHLQSSTRDFQGQAT